MTELVNVLHVSSYFAPAYVYGGPPRTVLGLCQGLQAAGVEVEVFTTTANGASELPPSSSQARSFEGVPVRYFPRRFPKRWFNAGDLSRALDRAVHRFDLVHVHGLWNVPGWRAIAACRRHEIPYVLSPRGMLDPGSFGYHRFRKRVFFELREKKSLHSAALVHATSEAEANAIRDRCPGAKVAVVSNGVSRPVRLVASGRRELGPIVFLGRLHPTKRLDLLLGAFERLCASMPEARLVLAGREDGVDAGRLVRESENVRWVGHISDDEKWALLAEARALVLCSDSESFGMSVLEALSVGVPVVVTQTCPWREVESFGCGLWVEQAVTPLADALERVLKDPVAAERMGERGKQLVSERYSWESVGRTMLRQYRAALGTSGLEGNSGGDGDR